MAKKVISTLKTGRGKDFSRVIKMVKSKKSDSYMFKDEIIHNEHVKDFLKD